MIESFANNIPFLSAQFVEHNFEADRKELRQRRIALAHVLLDRYLNWSDEQRYMSVGQIEFSSLTIIFRHSSNSPFFYRSLTQHAKCFLEVNEREAWSKLHTLARSTS